MVLLRVDVHLDFATATAHHICFSTAFQYNTQIFKSMTVLSWGICQQICGS